MRCLLSRFDNFAATTFRSSHSTLGLLVCVQLLVMFHLLTFRPACLLRFSHCHSDLLSAFVCVIQWSLAELINYDNDNRLFLYLLDCLYCTGPSMQCSHYCISWQLQSSSSPLHLIVLQSLTQAIIV